MMPLGGRAVTRAGDCPLSPRDAAVVELVGRCRLMTAEQIRSVFFGEQKSKTPFDRAMSRLVTGGYLYRLARFVGGFGGGSGQYVYQLDRAGWRSLGKTGSYRPIRVVDMHTLTISQCFVEFKALEKSGRWQVVEFLPEPGCHLQTPGVPLTPDAYVELGEPTRRLKFRYWLEIDRATEKLETIKDKCVRYWRAYQAWTEDVFPFVVFVVPDAARQREIERVVAGGPEEARSLFRIYQLDGLAEVIHRNMELQGSSCLHNRGHRRIIKIGQKPLLHESF